MSDTRFTHPRLVEIARYLDESRDELIRAARAVPSSHWSDAPSPGAWSPAQVVDHLRVVEHGIVRLFQKVLPEAIAAGLPAESASDSVLDRAFIARTMDRTRRIEAPARVVPTGSPDLEGGLAAMAAERRELLAAVARGDGLALGTLEWVHPALGTLDLYRWLVFVGAHEARHAQQLREMAAAFAA